NIGQRGPILGFTAPGLNDIASSASSWYHGLEASLTKRFGKGLQFLAANTWAHAYTASGRSTSGAGTAGTFGDQNKQKATSGVTKFDREHRFVLSFLYQLPIKHSLLGGWAVSGVVTLQSGLPLTLTGTNGNNVAGITSDRAFLAPGCTYHDLSTPGAV